MGKFDNYPSGVSEDDFYDETCYTLEEVRAKARLEHLREMLWEEEFYERQAKELDEDLKKCDT